MTIETKYNMGDKVWFNCMGTPMSIQISEINIAVEFDNCVLVRYMIGEYNEKYFFERDEDELFPTKEELLKSL